MGLTEKVKETLEEDSIESLEKLSEWWLEHEYTNNIWETKAQYEFRRDFVLPMIIEQKLLKYEEEY